MNFCLENEIWFSTTISLPTLTFNKHFLTRKTVFAEIMQTDIFAGNWHEHTDKIKQNAAGSVYLAINGKEKSVCRCCWLSFKLSHFTLLNETISVKWAKEKERHLSFMQNVWNWWRKKWKFTRLSTDGVCMLREWHKLCIIFNEPLFFACKMFDVCVHVHYVLRFFLFIYSK